MTTKILTGVYDEGYHVTSPVTTLSITASGYLFGSLTGGGGTYQVINDGGIYGVALSGASTVANDGTIRTVYRYGVAVYLTGGGTVDNGDANHNSALIEGGTALRNTYYHTPASDYGVVINGGPGAVTNFGTIEDRTIGKGVEISGAGTIINGSSNDSTALIQGLSGVVVDGAATIANFGSILANPNGGESGRGVEVIGPAYVTNGSIADTVARIDAIGIYYGGSVSNFGTVTGGVIFGLDNDRVTNGSTLDRLAQIEGYNGVYCGGSGTVSNFGTLEGAQARAEDGFPNAPAGLILSHGGVATNGSASDTVALVEGLDGLDSVAGYIATVKNFGTILGAPVEDYFGVQLAAGSLTNGSATDVTATIEGSDGVTQGRTYTAPVTVTNFGSIFSDDIGFLPDAVRLDGNDNRVINGSVSDHSALIEGDTAVAVGGGSTVINFGTLSGSLAVFMGGSTSLLQLESGSTMIGEAFVQNAIVDAVSGVAVIDGGLSTSGKVEGAGTLAISGIYTHFYSGTSLAVSEIEESGGSSLITVLTVLADSKTFVQTGGTVSVLTGDRISFGGSGDSFAGTLAGAGDVEFTGGSDLLTGVTLAATKLVVSNAAVTLAGEVTLDTTVSVTSPDLTIAAGGATLSGSGTISLTTNTTNEIEGGPLTNASRIVGTGTIAVSSLVNSGTIQASSADAFTINTGAATVINSGLIESTSTGGLTIDGALSQTGSLEAIKGTISVEGSVSGAGMVKLEGGTVDLAGAFSGAVDYLSAGGVLVLAHSKTDTVTITGFPKTSIGTIDLQDIKFTGATESFSGTATSGTLTIRNGANIATITLEGNYTTSTFTLSADSSGGTIVTDPVKTNVGPPPLQPLVSAIASFGRDDGSAAGLDPRDLSHISVTGFTQPVPHRA